MSGNEIILNLENHDNFTTSELIGGLIELGKRDKNYKFNWNNHPITASALKDVKSRIPIMNAKNVLQTTIFLDSLQIIDS